MVLQSIPAYKPLLSEVRDTPNFTSMPEFSNPRGLEHSTSDDTLMALGRYLRPTGPVPLDKMLTPVEERPSAEHDRESSSFSDEGDQDIIPTSSNKLDSTTAHSTYPAWHVGDLDSDRNSIRDSTSILSSECGTPPRSILNSTNSMDIAEINQAQYSEDFTKDFENHEEKASSQGSDDSSTFSESATTTHYGRGPNVNIVASPQGSGSFSFSSAEGTPVRTMSETRKRHPARQQADTGKQLVTSVSDSTTHMRKSRPRSSPHSSTHSSMSGTTISSQSSLGEEGGINSDASERRSRHLMKYGKYERYERYETRDRSKSLDTSPDFMRKKVDAADPPSDNEPSQALTQDSNGTLTESTTEAEVSSSHSVTSTDSFYQNAVNGQTPVIGTKEQHSKSEQVPRDSGEEKDEEDGVSDMLRDVPRMRDSGIDDTNSPVYKNSGNRRGSSICNDDDVALQDRESKPPASYKLVFNSRDSMLTDSPDTDSLNDDYVNSKSTQPAQKLATQYGKPSSVPDRQSRATSEGSEASVGSPAHVELIIEDGKPARLYEEPLLPLLSINFDDTLAALDPTISRMSDDDDSIHELERSGSSTTHAAPRSLEGPTFSRYARVPIRNTESKSHVRATDNPLYDASSNLRQRACSLNDLDEVSPSHSPEEERDPDERKRRAGSESRTPKSLTPNQSGSSLHSNPSGLPQSSSAIDLQEKSDSRAEVLKDKAIGGSLRLEKKPKKGKGFVSKLKPALRVLKIAPSSSVEGKKSQGKGSRFDKGRIMPSSASLDSPTSPSEYLTPMPRPYEEVRRMRMMSPEVMATQDDHQPQAMRRSQSSDDILDRSIDSSDSSSAATKVGPVYVIPEATKSKKRRRFGFQSKTKDRSKSRESSQSPVVLVDVQRNTRRVSVEPIVHPATNENGTLEISQQKSPKSKRRRHPHFV